MSEKAAEELGGDAAEESTTSEELAPVRGGISSQDGRFDEPRDHGSFGMIEYNPNWSHDNDGLQYQMVSSSGGCSRMHSKCLIDFTDKQAAYAVADLPLDLDAASKAVSNALAGIEVLTARTTLDSQPSTIDPSMPTRPRLKNRSQSLSSRALQQASDAGIRCRPPTQASDTGPVRFARSHDPSSHWGQQQGMYVPGIPGVHPSLQGQHQQQFLTRQSRQQQAADGIMAHGVTSYQSAPIPSLQFALGPTVPAYQNLGNVGGGMGPLNNFHEMQLRAQVQSLASQPQQEFGLSQVSPQQQVAWAQALMQQQQQQATATAQILLQQQLQQPSPHQLHAIYAQQQQLIHQLQQQQAQQLQMEPLSGNASLASGTSTFLPQLQNQFAAPLLQSQPQQQQHFAPLNGAGIAMPLHQGGPEPPLASSSVHLDMLNLYEEVSKAIVLAARQQGNEDVEQQLLVSSWCLHPSTSPYKPYAQQRMNQKSQTSKLCFYHAERDHLSRFRLERSDEDPRDGSRGLDPGRHIGGG